MWLTIESSIFQLSKESPMNYGMKSRFILPSEKPDNTIGSPAVSFRKVLDGILYVLELDVNGRCCQRNMALDQPVIDDSNNGHISKVFERLWTRLLKVYDDIVGIRWKWQSLDSISVKAPLRGITGNNPTNRCKLVTKRHVLTDQDGIPVILKFD